MASSKSATKNEFPKADQDLISSLPTGVTDKILKLLPLRIAARTSVLSTKWRQNWLCHRYLVFDAEFWEGQRTNGRISWQTICNIINTVLFHHNGPIHVFHLYIPRDVDQVMDLNLSQWLSCLSKHGIKQMTLANRHDLLPLPSRIFSCKDMVELSISKCILIPPPGCFEGFASLRSLEIRFIEFKHDSFRRLLASCPRLTALKLTEKWSHTQDLVIEVPRLEHLSVEGAFETLALKNTCRLKSISLVLYQSKSGISAAKITDIASLLSESSHKLQNLHLGGDLCKFLAAGAVTTRFSLAFNDLHTLSLANLDFNDFGVICFTIGMIQSCPFVKHLKLSISLKKSVDQHQFNYDYSGKFGQLQKVEIMCITGSTVELKLIEFILANSAALESLFLTCSDVDPISEVKVLRELLQLPRASAKAKLICLHQ